MKKILFLMTLCMSIFLTSCDSVQSGFEAAKVSWGGKTDMSETFGEGMHMGVNWLWDDLVDYDVREKTITEKFEFNDKNNMKTPVAISIDYKLQRKKVNVIHSTIGKDQLDAKIMTTLSSAAKQVIPQYSASELNLSKRDEAEGKILVILKVEFPGFYADCSRVRLTDVDIPVEIANAATQTAAQLEINKLAESKVDGAKKNFEAAEYDAKTKAILSQPAMLKMQELTVQMEWAKKGVSPYGNNNVFGGETAIVRGLK